MKTSRFLIPFLGVIFSSLLSFAQPLSGSYTIDAGSPSSATNFQSFNALSNALSTFGVSGPVLVTVEPGSGPYREKVVFSNISGIGASNPVLITGNGETISDTTSSTNRHIIRLSNLTHFNIDHLRVAWDSASSGGFYGIHIFGSGSDITISNCDIDISGTTSTLYGSIVASGSETSILETGNFHRLTIVNNTTVGGGYGVSVFGLLGNLASDILISENRIYDYHSNGVYLRETDGAIISYNEIDKRTSNVTSANAIQIAQNANVNASIYGNFIKVSQRNNGTMTLRGIYLFNGTGHKVYNNVIHDIGLTSGNFTAIDVRTAGSAPKIWFNTISMDYNDPNSGNMYGIREELSNTNSELRNNMISITQPGTGVRSGLALGSTSTVTSAFNSNYNNIYVPSGNVAVKSATPTVMYPTLSDWKTASTQDANSLSLDPMFVSVSNPVPTNLAMDNMGISIPDVTEDVLFNTRSPQPDIGAYEFTGVGIAGSIRKDELNVYPNPADEEIFINVSNDFRSGFSAEIFDTKGKMILSEMFVSPDETIRLKISELNSGIYLIKLRSGNRVSSGSFIKTAN
ncbi:MAG: T9SS C-terminal target domain-containing protein [Bacteroidetes bacterium]|nr:MAG: T9SS C-terminal target domain-containing protein [Bacteroidota bacterium]REK03399.1 MAG: T9SS C-terminal target domain-containing protein [Bacteroidota bacterium]REK34489.1 MAG: T9SS C-terminal target domain-containing protein [Bacteroidota bacterium]REK50393.1 MAG: T9SS C-terminal target domain-containing protein [Bacteroidota bacterium]